MAFLSLVLPGLIESCLSHPIQIVRALEHLHSKLSVIHRGQCPPSAPEAQGGTDCD